MTTPSRFSSALESVFHPRTGARRKKDRRLRLGDAVAMAVGGMIGGGIFSVLGVTVAIAGHLAFAAFLIGGVIAVLTARSFATLSLRSKKSGGLFSYLRDAGYPRAGAYLSWLLMAGYALALGVYGSTFGHYAADALGAPVWTSGLLAAAMIAVFLGVNLRGVGASALAEDAVVLVKVIVLAIIAGVGLSHFSPERLTPLADHGGLSLLLASTAIFVAYEGFELLTYDYDDLEQPDRTLPTAMYLAVGIVTTIYVLVALGSQMLVDDSVIVGDEAVAFAAAGRAALGPVGYWMAVLGAVLATGSAINATLFSTARQIREIARSGELPAFLGRDRRGLPVPALVALAAFGAAFGAAPDLTALIGFGSAMFLLVFAVTDLLAAVVATRRRDRVIGVAGFLACTAALIVLLVQLALGALGTFVAIVALVLLVTALRVVYVVVERRSAR